MHRVQKDAETMGCGNVVGDAEPPFEGSEYSPPAGGLRQRQDDGNDETYGDVRNSENSKTSGPFLVAVADGPSYEIRVGLVS